MRSRRRFLLTLVAGILPWGLVRAETPRPTAEDSYLKGLELQEKGRNQEAVAAFEEAISLGMTGSPRVFLYRANANRTLKNYDLAIAQYTDFLKKFRLEDSCRD